MVHSFGVRIGGLIISSSEDFEQGHDGETTADEPSATLDSVTLLGEYGTSRLLAAIVATTNDAVVVTSPEGVVVEWNPAAEGVYGYARQEALGQHVQVLYQTQSLPLFSALLEVAFRTGRAPFRKEVVRRDGSVIEVAGTISAVSDDTGAVVALVGIARSVTEPAPAL